jgi:hypothetical protein
VELVPTWQDTKPFLIFKLVQTNSTATGRLFFIFSFRSLKFFFLQGKDLSLSQQSVGHHSPGNISGAPPSRKQNNTPLFVRMGCDQAGLSTQQYTPKKYQKRKESSHSGQHVTSNVQFRDWWG